MVLGFEFIGLASKKKELVGFVWPAHAFLTGARAHFPDLSQVDIVYLDRIVKIGRATQKVCRVKRMCANQNRDTFPGVVLAPQVSKVSVAL